MRAFQPSRTIPRTLEARKEEFFRVRQVRQAMLENYARCVQAGLPLFDNSDPHPADEIACVTAEAEA